MNCVGWQARGVGYIEIRGFVLVCYRCVRSALITPSLFYAHNDSALHVSCCKRCR